jgi:flagellar motor protein MotB
MVPGGVPPQLAEMERRVQQLDVNNRQLTTQLAQSQQQMQVFRDRADLLQKQLQDTSNQLQQSRLAQQDWQRQAQGLQASTSLRGGATLRPNTSGQPLAQPSLGQPNSPATATPPSLGPSAAPPTGLNAAGPTTAAPNMANPNPTGSSVAGTAPSTAAPGNQTFWGQLGNAIPGASAALGTLTGSTAGLPPGGLQIPGATVQTEGSVIRVRVPADQLFPPGSGQLNPSAYQVLDNVATAVLRYFPRQRVAIEAHTDNSNLYGGTFSTQYQLASAQAQAVMDQLVRRNTLPTQQLTVVAHGPNFPRGDNQTAAGRAENRRIEFVVYPETF